MSKNEPNHGVFPDEIVNHPSHYKQLPLEVIDIIRLALVERYGKEGFEAYCFGNEIKYRLRAGFKGGFSEDISKAIKYCEFRKVSEMGSKAQGIA